MLLFTLKSTLPAFAQGPLCKPYVQISVVVCKATHRIFGKKLTEVKLKFIADYTQPCCVLTVEMNGGWLYSFLLPPNKTWHPAVQFEEPGSWARIVMEQ